jgi:hypothetical protein
MRELDVEDGREYHTRRLANHRHLRQRLGADPHHRDMTDRRRIGQLLVLAISVIAIDFGVAIVWGSLQSPRTTPTAIVVQTPIPSAAATALPSRCHSVNGLPDPACTPGLADWRVTQDNIHSTICVSGYTAKVRPSTRYTNTLKAAQITAYGYTDTNLADYEEDHLIPLELGGHPTDPRNLWPELRTGANAATAKDRLENSLHSKVCSEVMTLAAAQTAIATNWESP